MTHKPVKGTDHWCTPKWLADALGHFDVDPCSNERSHIQSCGRATGADSIDDGLTLGWAGSVFCNPPYSDVRPWAKRLSNHRDPWCALVKLDPTTKWWAELVRNAKGLGLFKKRLKFESGLEVDMTANFPSALVFKDWEVPEELKEKLWLYRL